MNARKLLDRFFINGFNVLYWLMRGLRKRLIHVRNPEPFFLQQFVDAPLRYDIQIIPEKWGKYGKKSGKDTYED